MPVTVILGTQWGDEGKGKGADVLAENADIVARFQGGPNAGHTIIIDGQKTVLHQVPSGILQPRPLCILGGGMVINPITLCQEIAALDKQGVQNIRGRLNIARNAHLILPLHIDRDGRNEKSHAIGTTGRGIGPAYTDKINRLGFRAGDILSPLFKQKVHLRVYDYLKSIDEKEDALILAEFFSACEDLRPYVSDTVDFIHSALAANKLILAEGAQGTLLDIDHGTYPFVTSSNTTIGGVCTGLGIPPQAITRVIGIVKAYTTRVGNGPFPTELFDETGALLQKRGDERGATTGRDRRCGWLDLPAIKYAVKVNGITELWLTKLDILDVLPEIRVCTEYIAGGNCVKASSVINCLETVTTSYVTLQGWRQEIRGIDAFDKLPETTQRYVRFIEDRVGKPITQIGTGPDRTDNINR